MSGWNILYLLTLSHGRFNKSSDRNKMRRLLRLGAPLTDLSPVGKMRDVYPLVITRIEHMSTLLLNDATAEAVVWLPLSFCSNAFGSRPLRVKRGYLCFESVSSCSEIETKPKNLDETQNQRRLKRRKQQYSRRSGEYAS
jgi:hypothetical protein